MWEIINVKVKTSSGGLNNIITSVTVKYSATYQGQSDAWYGQIDLLDPDPTNYISYEQVNESIVWQWLSDPTKVKDGQILNKPNIENLLLEMLKEKAVPSIVEKAPPWVASSPNLN